MRFPSRETCLHPSWPPSRHISSAAKFPGRQLPTYFPPSHLASRSGREISGSVAYVRTDFAEDMLSLLSGFLELASLTTCLDCSYSLRINTWLSVAALFAGLCWGSLLENSIHCCQFSLLKPPPSRLVIFRTSPCCPSQEYILPILIPRRLVVGARKRITIPSNVTRGIVRLVPL